MDFEKYHVVRALRPFSLSVALCVCLTGIAAASAEVAIVPERLVLVLLAGLLLQAGVNLINDYADLQALARYREAAAQQAQRAVKRNFRLGLACFAGAAIIASYLISLVGWPLLLISLVGLVGALGYTLEPFNYKARGLGVVLVFWLMGVLMVMGSYLVMTDTLNWLIVWQSIPISLLVSLLLLSNELRDYEADRREGIGTLAVKIGYQPACRLYIGLLAASYLSALLLWWGEALALFWPLLISGLLVPSVLRLLTAPAAQRRSLTPRTGRLLALFGLIYCLLLSLREVAPAVG